MVSMSKNVIKIHWRHDIDEKIKIQSAMWFRRNEQNTSATWFRRKYRLWQPWRNKIDLEVLGLSLFPSPDIDNWMEANPEQQVVTTMQVHQGDQPRLPPSCIASLACVCMMAACPLHKQKTNKRRSFTSLQMSHTLDKNGSLYDPAGTESWNMQIRVLRPCCGNREEIKLTWRFLGWASSHHQTLTIEWKQTLNNR